MVRVKCCAPLSALISVTRLSDRGADHFSERGDFNLAWKHTLVFDFGGDLFGELGEIEVACPGLRVRAGPRRRRAPLV